MNLHCMLDPVQYREYEYGRFTADLITQRRCRIVYWKSVLNFGTVRSFEVKNSRYTTYFEPVGTISRHEKYRAEYEAFKY